jgi:hypothetical protein
MPYSTALKSQVVELVARLTTSYIDLAKSVARFMAIEPSPSMEEAAVAWLISATMKAEAFGQPSGGRSSQFDSFFNEFLAIAFGQILEDLEALRAGEIPTFAELKQAAPKILENLPSERATTLVETGGAIALIAGQLAQGTLDIALQCLTDGEKRRAHDTALSLLASHSLLDPSVVENAEMWITAASWARSSFDIEVN